MVCKFFKKVLKLWKTAEQWTQTPHKTTVCSDHTTQPKSPKSKCTLIWEFSVLYTSLYNIPGKFGISLCWVHCWPGPRGTSRHWKTRSCKNKKCPTVPKLSTGLYRRYVLPWCESNYSDILIKLRSIYLYCVPSNVF